MNRRDNQQPLLHEEGESETVHVEPIWHCELRTDTEIDEQELEAKRWSMTTGSYWTLAFIMLLDSIEFSILIPTLYQFLQSTKKDPDADVTNAYGLILSSFSAAALISKPILGWLGDKTAMKLVFAWSTLVAALGNILYSLSAYLALEYLPKVDLAGEIIMLSARVLSGVGCANTSLVFAFVARTVKPSERTGKITALSMIKVLGVLVGPAVTCVTNSVDFKVSNFLINYQNAPGFFIAALQFISILATLFFLKEPLSYREADRLDGILQRHVQQPTQATKVTSSMGHFQKYQNAFKQFFSSGMVLCFFVILYFNFQMACVEALATPTAVDVLNWSSVTISFTFVLFASVVIVGNIFVIQLSKKGVDDTVFIMFGALLGLIAPIVLKMTFLWDMPPSAVLVSFSLFVAPMPFVFSPARSIFTRLVEGSHSQGFLSAWLSVTASVGGIIGPLCVGWLLSSSKPHDGSLHHPFAPLLTSMMVALGAFAAVVIAACMYLFIDKIRMKTTVVVDDAGSTGESDTRDVVL